MARHLKNIVMSGLKNIISSYVPSPAVSTPPASGVRYFHPITDIDFLWGAMDKLQLGRKRRKHIIVRRYPHMGNRLLQLYTYHFPKTWSAACVANRELIKFAQRQAHALKHDTSRAGLEWHIRFLRHYFTVVKGGAKPEPGLKPYSRFYQYTYVAIYRQLKAALQNSSSPAQSDSSALTPDDVTFDPIDHRPLRSRRAYPLHYALTADTSVSLHPFPHSPHIGDDFPLSPPTQPPPKDPFFSQNMYFSNIQKHKSLILRQL